MKATAVFLTVICILILACLFLDYDAAIVFVGSFLLEGFLVGSGVFVVHMLRKEKRPDKVVFVVMLNDSVMGAALTQSKARVALDRLAREHYNLNRWNLAGSMPIDLFTYEHYRANAGCYWAIRNTTLYP